MIAKPETKYLQDLKEKEGKLTLLEFLKYAAEEIKTIRIGDSKDGNISEEKFSKLLKGMTGHEYTFNYENNDFQKINIIDDETHMKAAILHGRIGKYNRDSEDIYFIIECFYVDHEVYVSSKRITDSGCEKLIYEYQNNYYIASYDKLLFKVDLKGKILWKAKLPDDVYSFQFSKFHGVASWGIGFQDYWKVYFYDYETGKKITVRYEWLVEKNPILS